MGRVVFNISRDPNIPRVRVSSENRQTVCFCATVIIVYLSMASRSVVACLLLAMYKCGHGFGQPCSTFDMVDFCVLWTRSPIFRFGSGSSPA